MTNSYLHLIHEEYSQTGIPFNNKWNIIFQSILREVLKRIVKQTNRQYLHTFKFSLFFNTWQNKKNKTVCFNLILRFSRNDLFFKLISFPHKLFDVWKLQDYPNPSKTFVFPLKSKSWSLLKSFSRKTLLTLNDNRIIKKEEY